MPDAMIEEEIFRLVPAWAADQQYIKARGLTVWEISDRLAHRVSLRSCGVLVGLAAYADMLDLPTAAD